MGSVLLGLSLGATASAADIYVPGDYPTIEAAVNFAAEGDRVLVSPGVWLEDLSMIFKTVTIENTGGDAFELIIRSPGPDPYVNDVILVQGGTLTLRNLTVDGNFERRAVQAFNGATVVLDTVTIINGDNVDGYPGGGLDLWSEATAIVSNSTFDGNWATYGYQAHGGNIAVEDTAAIDFSGINVVRNGVSERGGGLWVQYGGIADVWAVTFDNNSATGFGDNDGGAVCAEEFSTVSIEESQFTDNSAGMDADSSGGAIFSRSALTRVSDSTFYTNTAHAGGGVAVEDYPLIALNNHFDTNNADKGAGISCVFSNACFLAGNRYENNTVDEMGAAVFMWSSFGIVDSDTYCSNAISPFATYGMDGGAIRQAEGVLEVRNTVFANNAATDSGGAISMSDGVLDTRNNHFLANDAAVVGGAVHAAQVYSPLTTAHSLNDLYYLNSANADGAIHYAGGLLNTVRYAWLEGNLPGHGTIGVLPSNLVDAGDPLLSGWTPGSCEVLTMLPEGQSGLIDAGDPSLLDFANGSRSDIGAFGGSRDDTGGITDADLDGIPDEIDCDDTDASVGVATRWHPDADGDGFGDTWLFEIACSPSDPSWISNAQDCDDSNAMINPNTPWWNDEDGDGWGDVYFMINACDPPPSFVDNSLDCYDLDPSIGPPSVWYEDPDGDGFGGDNSTLACDQPVGWAPNADDCDNNAPGTYPGAAEFCDNIDQDCDDVIDNDAVDAVTRYVDEDGDGYGDPGRTRTSCKVDGLSENGDDCDDANAGVYPGAPDAWYDGIDSNCDGLDDFDQDRDGYAQGDDCNDIDERINPGAEEVLDDGVDRDCDGIDGSTWISGGAGCACDSAPSSGAGWAVLALLGLVARRRRS